MRLRMPREMLFASSYGIARELCDEQRFQKAVVGPLEEARNLGRDGLFTAHNHEHNWERTLVLRRFQRVRNLPHSQECKCFRD